MQLFERLERRAVPGWSEERHEAMQLACAYAVGTGERRNSLTGPTDYTLEKYFVWWIDGREWWPFRAKLATHEIGT